jgi:site-specific recombinase XerD
MSCNKETLLEKYINRIKEKGLSYNTERLYIRVYKSFLDWRESTEGDFELDTVDKGHLMEYKLFVSRSLSPSSLSTYLKILSKEFNINLIEKKKTTQLEQLPGYLSEFPKWLFLKGMSKNTIDGYLKKTLAFISWFEKTIGRNFTPSEITNYDILRYRTCLQDQRRAPAAVSTALCLQFRLFVSMEMIRV